MKVKAKEQLQIAEVLSEMGMSDEIVEIITQIKPHQPCEEEEDSQ
ncbi:hypothetical protein [Massilicoli timonensis]|nr:hypothetical protein [Massilicoli timonensis]